MSKQPKAMICTRCDDDYGIHHYGYPIFMRDTIASLCISCYKILKVNANSREEEIELVSK